MMKAIIFKSTGILALAATLTACGEIEIWETDQSKRQELFKECMELLPSGPKSTHYNDWAEVVDECNDYARYAAKYCVQKCSEGVQTKPFITPNQSAN
jgi:hypothetical protein